MPTAHRVVALAYDRLATFEFAVAVEIFGLPRPELPVDWYRFSACSYDAGPLRATGGVRLIAGSGLGALRRADTIVIPGWRNPDELPPRPVLSALRRAHDRGARLMSICSGVFVLAATGLLDGKRATTHWRYVEKLRAMYPRIEVEPDVLYVDEGNVLTSAGEISAPRSQITSPGAWSFHRIATADNLNMSGRRFENAPEPGSRLSWSGQCGGCALQSRFAHWRDRRTCQSEHSRGAFTTRLELRRINGSRNRD